MYFLKQENFSLGSCRSTVLTWLSPFVRSCLAGRHPIVTISPPGSLPPYPLPPSPRDLEHGDPFPFSQIEMAAEPSESEALLVRFLSSTSEVSERGSGQRTLLPQQYRAPEKVGSSREKVS